MRHKRWHQLKVANVTELMINPDGSTSVTDSVRVTVFLAPSISTVLMRCQLTSVQLADTAHTTLG